MFRFLLTLALIASAIGTAAAQSSPPPERPFTLLLITGQGSAADQALRQMVFKPSTKQMQRWASWATPKELSASSPIVKEHHADILRDAQSLPALALVDSMNGSRWHLMSGDNLPRAEYELARTLDVYYAATMEAARTTPANAVQSVDRRAYDINKNAAFSLPIRNVSSGPAPYQPSSGGSGGGGIFPDLNIPDSFDANANVQVEGETRRWATWVLAAVVFCVLFLGFVSLGVAWMVCEAFTAPNAPPTDD